MLLDTLCCGLTFCYHIIKEYLLYEGGHIITTLANICSRLIPGDLDSYVSLTRQNTEEHYTRCKELGD